MPEPSPRPAGAADADLLPRIYEHAPPLCYTLTLDGRVVSSNGAVARATGRPAPGSDVAAAFLPEDRPELRRIVAAAAAEPGALFRAQLRQRTRDGRVVQLAAAARAAPEPDGPVLLACLENTELAERERDLARNVAIERAILECTADGICATSDDGRILRWNRRFQRIWDIPREVLDAADARALYRHARERMADPDRFRARIRTIVAAPADPSMDVFDLADGRALALVTRPFTVGGQPRGRVFSTRDVTAERRAREALAAGEARYRALYEEVPAMYAILGADFRYRSVNAYGLAAFGYDAEIARGLPFDAVVHPEDRARARRQLEACLADPSRPRTTLLRKRTRSGKVLWVEQVARAVRNPLGETELLLFCTDVSRRVAEEQERQRLEAQLRHAQKMDAIGTLAGGIAHDINNHLMAIRLNADLALMAVTPGHPAREPVEAILEVVRHSSALVRQILAFAAGADAPRAPVDVRQAAEEAARLVRTGLTSGVRLEVDLGDAPVHAVASVAQLHQVLLNLGTNAARARPSRIGLRVRRVEAASPIPVDAGAVAAGTWAEITVEDDGRGMDEAVRQRIFEPFFTTAAPGEEGRGLGLAVVHGIVTASGGGIAVESAPGRGTTFRVYLPACDPPARHDAAGAAPAGSGRGRRILLVDDERPVLDALARALRAAGFAVAATTDPNDALARLRQDPREFDALVTDQTMPGLAGDALAGEARALRPDLPVVICTGNAARVDRAAARTAGVATILEKPVGGDDVARALAELLPRDP